MRRFGVAAIVLMLAGSTGFLAGCEAGNRGQNTATTTADDPGDRVSRALKDANIDGVNVDYDKDANVVHLKGTVNNPADKSRAEQVATGAVGTTGKVLNELTVEGRDEERADDNDNRIKDALDKQIEDDPALRDRSVRFDVNNGVVTVSGSVRTADEKARITKMVRAVPGVKDMANELKVEPKK